MVARGQLEGETVLLLDDGHYLRQHAQEICSRVGARDEANFQGTSLATVCRMVAAGMGVTLLPECARGVEACEGTGLVVRPFSDADPSRQVVLMWRRNAPARGGLPAHITAQPLGRLTIRAANACNTITTATTALVSGTLNHPAPHVSA